MTGLRRSPMPQRSAPLARTTELRSTSVPTRTTALLNGGPLVPSRMPARSSTPQRTARLTGKPSPRRAADMVAWALTRAVLYGRAAGRCEIGGEPLTLDTMHGHHRQRRELGNHTAVNGLCLCPVHHEFVHAHPDWSRRHGWIVPSYADPASWAVHVVGDRVVHLDSNGGYAALTNGD